LLGQNGSASNPTWSFINMADSGFWADPSNERVYIAVNDAYFRIEDYGTNAGLQAGTDGGPTAPVYTFASDNQDGMYRTSGGFLGFSAGGNENLIVAHNSLSILNGGGTYSYSLCTSQSSAGSKGTYGRCTSSSIRHKSDVQDFSDDEVDRVFRMRPTSFVHRDIKEHRSYGFIAEELNELFPELVYSDNKDRIMGVQYKYITALNNAGIKFLKEKIDELRLENIDLRMENDFLHERLDAVEARLEAAGL